MQGPASLDLGNIQGNIVPGFNKDHQAFIFVTFPERESARDWLKRLAPEIASAKEVQLFKELFETLRKRRKAQGWDDEGTADAEADRDFGALRTISATWLNIALSFRGLQLLAGDALDGFPGVFRANRVPATLVAEWPDASHALVIVAADRVEDREAELDRQRRWLDANRLGEVAILCGDTLPGKQRGREQFGFRDGISQPAIVGTSFGTGEPVAAGEFILGQPDQIGKTNVDGLPEWVADGSYVAFLQIEQHVDAFRRAIRSNAAQLALDPADVAAALVGRGLDAAGTPVADPPTRLSHIGRAYPGWQPGNESARHRLIRRSIPYGQPLTDGERETGDRGLLFLTYQSDLERQFEHVWTIFLNGPDFPMPGAGREGLVGQLSPPGATGPLTRTSYLPEWTPTGKRPALISISSPGQNGGTINLSLPAFVTPHYGGYFFAPSIRALTTLATDPRV